MSLQDENSDNPSEVYYGLFIPKEEKQDEDFKFVYTDKQEILNLVKKYKESRFKAFASFEDALQFASGEFICSPVKQELNKNILTENRVELKVSESSNAFKCPKPQDLSKLRRAIEKGEEENFIDTVWSNPYYLISSGDTPVILHEGCRYNALHVAAKANQLQMVKTILETVENPFFLQLLFTDDDEATCKQRMKYLVDLYLNTPDKGFCETPLHFAAKFGHASIVKFLLSHPSCEKNPENKEGETPKEIACSRCPKKNAELKQEIESYFESQYYVPILYREDNSAQAILVKPLTFNKDYLTPFTGDMKSPILSSMKVRAYAGPMPKVQAEDFYKNFRKWNSGDGINQIAGLSDYEKGLERLGRKIAKELNVPWTEYWPCLKTYCDITSREGLRLLEDFFEDKLNSLRELVNQTNDVHINSITPEKENSNLSKNSSGLSSICATLQSYKFTPGFPEDSLCSFTSLASNEDVFVTPPSSPRSSPYGSTCSLDSLDNECPLFVESLYPTKSDKDILRAIEDVEINTEEFPLICRWKNHILSFPDEVSTEWPSPYSPRYTAASGYLLGSPLGKLSDHMKTPVKTQSNDKKISSIKKNLFKLNTFSDV